MKRRDLLKASAALAVAGFPASPLWEAANVTSLKPQAGHPYQAPVGDITDEVNKLDWDQFQSIQYRQDHELWADDKLRFRAHFFYLGLYFKTPVQIYEVNGGQGQELAYDPAMFDYSKSGLHAYKMPKDLGFASFESTTRTIGSVMLQPFSAPVISARSAGNINTACRRADWQSMLPCRASRNFRCSPPSGWNGQPLRPTGWWCMRCSIRLGTH